MKCTTILYFLAALAAFSGFVDAQEETMDERTTNTAEKYEWSPEITQSFVESKEAAQQWLNLMDKGQYAQAWRNGAKLFQSTISEQEWVQVSEVIRNSLGTFKSREIIDQRPAFDPQGLPKGAYMVIFYSSDFSKKQNAVELLTLMKESDGKWKVLTYQAK